MASSPCMRPGAWPTLVDHARALTAQLVHGHGRAHSVAEKGGSDSRHAIITAASTRRHAMRRRRAAVASMAVAREVGRLLSFFSLAPIPMHQRRRTRQQLTSTAARCRSWTRALADEISHYIPGMIADPCPKCSVGCLGLLFRFSGCPK